MIIKHLAISAFIVLSTFPMVRTLTLNYYDDSRIYSIIAILIITFATATSTARRENHTINIKNILPLGLLSTGILLTALANQDLNTIINAKNIILLIILAISFKHKERDIDIIFITMLFSSAILITKCYLYLYFAITVGYFNDPLLLIAKFENIRFFNQFQIFALVCTLKYLGHGKLGRLASYNLFSQLLFLFLTGGRGVTLSWLILIGLLMINKNYRILAHTALKYTLASFIAFILINYLLTLNLTEVFLLRGSSSLRIPMWLEALDNITWSNIFYGYGGGNYNEFTSISSMSHPHNLILQIISEWGLIFSAGFLGLLAMAITRNATSLFGKEKSNYTFLLLGFIAALVNAQFDGTFHNPVGQLLSFTFLGLLLNRASPSGDETTLSFKLGAQSRIFFTTILICFALFYLWLCWLYFLQVQSNPAPFYGGPYFWLTGEKFTLSTD